MIGMAVWLAVLWALAWTCMLAVEQERRVLALALLAGFVALLFAGIAYVYWLGEVAS